MTENYWDWKLLINNLIVFLIPISSLAFCHPIRLTKLLKCWLKYAWVIFLILMPFLETDAYGRYLVPFTFLSLFLPILNKKYIAITIIAFLITLVLGSSSRSDVIKFSVCLLLGISSIFPNLWIKRKVLLTISISIVITPVLLFALGATNVFNIFKIEENLGIKGEYTIQNSSGEEYSALTDTRTFIYIEVINSAINNDYVLFGRSIARGYDSKTFGELTDETLGTKRGERQKSEVSILNIFNYLGLIGVVLYCIIFCRGIFLSIYKSKNIFIPIIGIYIAFRWLFAWIEDFSRFDLNYLFLWILIGICYSPIFRNMKNRDIKKWINSITQ